MNSAKWRNDVIAHHVASSKLHKHSQDKEFPKQTNGCSVENSLGISDSVRAPRLLGYERAAGKPPL